MKNQLASVQIGSLMFTWEGKEKSDLSDLIFNDDFRKHTTEKKISQN
jgi:hypothetical protein